MAGPPGDEDKDGKPIHGDTTVEIIWTIIPTDHRGAFAVAAGIVLVKNETVPHDRLQRAASTASSSPGGSSIRAVQVPRAVLPIDKPTEFVIRSVEESCIDAGTNWKKCGDVIHSFYVPEFRVKADAVPGIINRTYAEPTRGTYPLICTELCGLGHSEMRSIVQGRLEGRVNRGGRPARPETRRRSVDGLAHAPR